MQLELGLTMSKAAFLTCRGCNEKKRRREFDRPELARPICKPCARQVNAWDGWVDAHAITKPGEDRIKFNRDRLKLAVEEMGEEAVRDAILNYNKDTATVRDSLLLYLAREAQVLVKHERLELEALVTKEAS
jgi:hypothetical protein